MAVSLRANVGLTQKHVCLELELNQEMVNDTLATCKLTKRLCLRVTMMQYDPLGMAMPVILQLKALMQQTFSPEYRLDWDTELPADLVQD